MTAVLLCNGSTVRVRSTKKRQLVRMEYQPGAATRNMNVSLPAFERKMLQVPARILDLLEVAAYVFCADRLIRRGAKDDVEYQTWSRDLEFHIRVRDLAFWERREVQALLRSALEFMSGDRTYEFVFEGGHATQPASLFSAAGVTLPASNREAAVMLFSGGLDSLTGAISHLAAGRKVCLVSHRSQPGTISTQNALVAALQRRFPDQAIPYGFDCTLHAVAAPEESQRTRAFLYSSIGFAVAAMYGTATLDVFENGVTSMNFRRREDQGLARASRTTHPKTMRLLEGLYTLVANDTFTIRQPFLRLTKAEVVSQLRDSSVADLIDSTVSCSQTRKNLGMKSQCGICYQCVDRRMAVFATGVDEQDHPGLYACDFLSEPLAGEAKTVFVDYVRQAVAFVSSNVDHFYADHLLELGDIADGVPELSEMAVASDVYTLSQRHGADVMRAIRAMVSKHDDPARPRVVGSALDLIAHQEYLKEPVLRLVHAIIERVEPGIQRTFAKGRLPADENDFNQKVGALIQTFHSDLVSEHPAVSFACAGVTPDHQAKNADLLIESKYIRGGTTPAKVRDPMSADLTNCPSGKHLLFLVFDPGAAIADARQFVQEFESKGRCTVQVIR